MVGQLMAADGAFCHSMGHLAPRPAPARSSVTPTGRDKALWGAMVEDQPLLVR